jgi:hypothetical protein
MVQQTSAFGKRLAHIAELIEKNLQSLARARGFERVQTRERGARHPKVRWRRPVLSPAAAQPKPQPADPARYFAVEIEARPGINHLRFALELLLREAAALGRTPLLFEPRFDPRHNLGHDLRTSWRRYLDLDAIEVVNRASGESALVKAVCAADVPRVDQLSTAWFERDHTITADENQCFDVLVRRNRTGLHVPPVHDGPAGLPDYTVQLPASALVHSLAQAVKAELGANYCAMHVRRDDMLAMKEQYPNLDTDTRPDNIIKVLRANLAPASRVYVMTNERDTTFFDPLRAEYELHQYFDFPALRTLIECEEPDNFLLFEVEKQLFEHAPVKVHTFAHPKGAPRIALSTDTGWA